MSKQHQESSLVFMVETSRETSQQKAQVTFPPFCSQKKSFLSGKNEDKESMALELKELSGKGLTSADIQAVLNQEIMILKEIVFMRYCWKCDRKIIISKQSRAYKLPTQTW